MYTSSSSLLLLPYDKNTIILTKLQTCFKFFFASFAPNNWQNICDTAIFIPVVELSSPFYLFHVPEYLSRNRKKILPIKLPLTIFLLHKQFILSMILYETQKIKGILVVIYVNNFTGILTIPVITRCPDIFL